MVHRKSTPTTESSHARAKNSGYWTSKLRQAVAHLIILSLAVLHFAVSGRAEARSIPSDPSDPAALCETAAVEAARETGVPLAVLRAISLSETGRNRGGSFRPWPWTVNMEGAGAWFDEPDEALGFVRRHFETGARSFDVGCFQLNYRWHGQNFQSIESMFDPLENARYAARFLAGLYAETGDWMLAAGYYHSRTPSLADRYSSRFQRILSRLDDGRLDMTETPKAETSDTREVEAPRVNGFPLLRASPVTAALGSLVPLAEVPQVRLIEPAGHPLRGSAEYAG